MQIISVIGALLVLFGAWCFCVIVLIFGASCIMSGLNPSTTA